MTKLVHVSPFLVAAGYFVASLAHATVPNISLHQDPCTYTEFNRSQLQFARNGGIAGSPPLQRLLAAKEELIYTVVKEYLHHLDLKKNLDGEHTRDCHYQATSRYIQHFEATTGLIKHGHGPAPDRPSNVSWNPLLVYHMFNRMWKLVAPLITCFDSLSSHDLGLRNQIVDLLADIGIPTEEDVRLAIRSILRIQHVYDLDTVSMANGWLDGFNTGVTLSAWDCNAIGEQALADKKYAAAVEWFEAASKCSASVLESIFPISEDALRINLGRSVAEHDLISDPWNDAVYAEKLGNNSENRIRMRTHLTRTWGGHTDNYYVPYNYYGVCSGELQQSEVVKAKLFCYHETKAHPVWTINPLKVELLSLQPLLILKYHSFIGDKVIQMIQNEAVNSMARSAVDGRNSSEISDARTSMNAWIDDNYRDEFKHIPEMIERITGLRIRQSSSSDSMQVAFYSAGSHYSVHRDAGSTVNLNIHQGHRIATFLFYLSDVVKGGGTAFPQSQVQVIPDRGSAVLWYNLQKNGNVDDMTWHGSCPVVIGEKWIGNKWVRVNDQMFQPNYQCCSRDPNAKIEVTINGRPVSDFY